MILSRRGLFASAAALLTSLATPLSVHASQLRSLKNALDISWLPDVEAAGGLFFTDNGKRIDAVALLKLSGVKVGRIRVFVKPASKSGSLETALVMAKRLKSHGIEICIDLHYSDTWADPSHQTSPAGWPSEIESLEKQIQKYTQETLQEFVKAGTPPQWVQIGNEIAGGFLWPLGKISTGDSSQWENFVRLHNAGTKALRSVLPQAKSILHLECGGDYQRVRWWLQNAEKFGLDSYDVVGLSYYSQWHGGLLGLSKTMHVVTSEFMMPVIIAETAYPWTRQRFGDDVIDIDKAALPGYSFSPQGQRKYVASLENLLRKQPHNLGLGMWWWEGFARIVRTPEGTITWNAGMANSTLVDISGKALPALAALNAQ